VIKTFASGIDEALARDNFALAHILYWEWTQREQNEALASEYLKRICEGFGFTPSFRIGGPQRASSTFSASLDTNPEESDQNDRYHLIHAWGFGFWSDVNHVVIQSMLAEMLGRTPVVYWGENSNFKHPTMSGNHFENFFERLAPITVDELSPTDAIYPPKWRPENLKSGNNNKIKGSYSRHSALYCFNRHEAITVSDFYTSIHEIRPWIHPKSTYFGLDESAIFRRGFAKYLRPRSHIINSVDTFEAQYLAGSEWVAVHLRGTDKFRETPEYLQLIPLYHRAIQRLIERNPDLRIFLLTESIPLLTHFSETYPSRVLATQVTRRSDAIGLHLIGDDGYRLGAEVLIDSLIAARCNYFIGTKVSNVSLAIDSLKDWTDDRALLIGHESARMLNRFIHQM
jgi:protein O-GlcNAc transferase